MAAKKDLENFLQDVDEIGFIIKNLSSEDEEKHREGMEASEKFMSLKDQEKFRTKYDKTLVNIQNNSCFEEQHAQEQGQLLKGIELDAKERTKRRKINEADAVVLKLKGNAEFKTGRYQEAIDCYTEAIKLVKYFPALYTNRGQAFIKLENYDAAIDDCKWALRIDEKCVKAYVHCGRALQKKACFSEAISFFRKGQEIDPKQRDVIAGYILQTEKEQQKHDLERKIIEKQKNIPCLKAVGENIEVLGKNCEKLENSTICVRNLDDLLENNDESKTLFRVLKGFECFGKDTEFHRLCENCATWDNAAEEMFVYEMLNLGRIAIDENEQNVDEILNHEVLDVIHKLCHKCDAERVLLASMKLLHQLTGFTLGRERILNYAERNRRFVEELFKFLEEKNVISKVAMGCMNNLSLEEKFSLRHSLQLERVVLSLVETFLIHYLSSNSELDAKTLVELVSSGLATLANLTRVKEIRNRLQRNSQVWRLCIDVLTRYCGDISRREMDEVIFAALMLLINLSTEDSINLKNHAISITPFLLKLLVLENRDLVQRVLGVLRLLMTYSAEVVEIVCKETLYEILLRIIERNSDDLAASYAVKCLALCTDRNTDAATYISSNGLKLFHRLLLSKHDIIVGNSALILRSCFEQDKACEQLVGTSIVKDFLTLATRKDLSQLVKQNVAIALAKLVQQDVRFLEQLRELHGLEILHSVIQLNSL